MTSSRPSSTASRGSDWGSFGLLLLLLLAERARWVPALIRPLSCDISSAMIRSDFERSRALAEAICANGLIFVNTSREEQVSLPSYQLVVVLKQRANLFVVSRRLLMNAMN